MFEELQKLSHHFLKIKNQKYRRYLIEKETFSHRMSVIKGQRGVGKTTTLIQLLLDQVSQDRFDNRILYIQADHFLMGSFTLYEVAEQFQIMGGKWLAFDEIHKYPDWSKELKSIYDTFPNLKILASGSSALKLFKGSHDLTRRAICYPMHGLSFREFLELGYRCKFQTFTLKEICEEHQKIGEFIREELRKQDLKILPQFHQYLKTGFYPYFEEIKNEAEYFMTLEQNVHTAIESDLAATYPSLTAASINKIKKLLAYISNSVPFIPNWKKVLSVLEVGDVRTLKTYFSHLEDADLIRSVYKATDKFSQLETPGKVFLDNPNQLFAISPKLPEKGNVRETFFLSAFAVDHDVRVSQNGDFLVDGESVFEIGGRKKTFHQVKEEKQAYLACDGIEEGVGRKIPLWLFGFLY